MTVNWVVCRSCGRGFDPTQEQSFFDQAAGNYVCSQCLARGDMGQPKKKRNKVASGIRIALAVLFIWAAFDLLREGSDSWSFGLVLGLLLLLWQFWPQLKALTRRKQNQIAVQKQTARKLEREAEKQKVCPHCGAAVTGLVCEYCGMPFDGK